MPPPHGYGGNDGDQAQDHGHEKEVVEQRQPCFVDPRAEVQRPLLALRGGLSRQREWQPNTGDQTVESSGAPGRQRSEPRGHADQASSGDHGCGRAAMHLLDGVGGGEGYGRDEQSEPDAHRNEVNGHRRVSHV